MKFLATDAGLINENAIVLIDDEPGAQYEIHYSYGLEVRTTKADRSDVSEFLRGQSAYGT